MVLRRIGAGILIALAVASWFALEPRDISFGPGDTAAQIETIQTAADEADLLSETVYQQQVAESKEQTALLQLIAAQTSDKRPATLLMIGVLGLLLAIITAPPRRMYSRAELE